MAIDWDAIDAASESPPPQDTGDGIDWDSIDAASEQPPQPEQPGFLRRSADKMRGLYRAGFGTGDSAHVGAGLKGVGQGFKALFPGSELSPAESAAAGSLPLQTLSEIPGGLTRRIIPTMTAAGVGTAAGPAGTIIGGAAGAAAAETSEINRRTKQQEARGLDVEPIDKWDVAEIAAAGLTQGISSKMAAGKSMLEAPLRSQVKRMAAFEVPAAAGQGALSVASQGLNPMSDDPAERAQARKQMALSALFSAGMQSAVPAARLYGANRAGRAISDIGEVVPDDSYRFASRAGASAPRPSVEIDTLQRPATKVETPEPLTPEPLPRFDALEELRLKEGPLVNDVVGNRPDGSPITRAEDDAFRAEVDAQLKAVARENAVRPLKRELLAERENLLRQRAALDEQKRQAISFNELLSQGKGRRFEVEPEPPAPIQPTRPRPIPQDLVTGEVEGSVAPIKSKEIPDDTQNLEGLPSQERVGQEPVEAGSVESASGEAAGAGRVLQAQEGQVGKQPWEMRSSEYQSQVADESVVQPASLTDSGRVATGGRIHALIPMRKGESVVSEGFITNKGRYVSRSEAAMLTGGKDYWRNVESGMEQGAAETLIPNRPPEEYEGVWPQPLDQDAFHRASVEKAIREGKITSHPDYPELSAQPAQKEVVPSEVPPKPEEVIPTTNDESFPYPHLSDLPDEELSQLAHKSLVMERVATKSQDPLALGNILRESQKGVPNGQRVAAAVAHNPYSDDATFEAAIAEFERYRMAPKSYSDNLRLRRAELRAKRPELSQPKEVIPGELRNRKEEGQAQVTEAQRGSETAPETAIEPLRVKGSEVGEIIEMPARGVFDDEMTAERFLETYPESGWLRKRGDKFVVFAHPDEPPRAVTEAAGVEPVVETPAAPAVKEPWDVTADEYDAVYPLASDVVDGMRVRGDTPNESSIDSSLNEYTELKGVREVPMSAFEDQEPPQFYSAEQRNRTLALAEEIKASGEINPLIVAYDSKGPYILEGGHRYNAMKLLGKKAIPAKVVFDEESLYDAVDSALSVGGSVRRELLADYPDLAQKYAKAVARQKPKTAKKPTQPKGTPDTYHPPNGKPVQVERLGEDSPTTVKIRMPDGTEKSVPNSQLDWEEGPAPKPTKPAKQPASAKFRKPMGKKGFAALGGGRDERVTPTQRPLSNLQGDDLDAAKRLAKAAGRGARSKGEFYKTLDDMGVRPGLGDYYESLWKEVGSKSAKAARPKSPAEPRIFSRTREAFGDEELQKRFEASYKEGQAEFDRLAGKGESWKETQAKADALIESGEFNRQRLMETGEGDNLNKSEFAAAQTLADRDIEGVANGSVSFDDAVESSAKFQPHASRRGQELNFLKFSKRGKGKVEAGLMTPKERAFVMLTDDIYDKGKKPIPQWVKTAYEGITNDDSFETKQALMEMLRKAAKETGHNDDWFRRYIYANMLSPTTASVVLIGNSSQLLKRSLELPIEVLAGKLMGRNRSFREATHFLGGLLGARRAFDRARFTLGTGMTHSDVRSMDKIPMAEFAGGGKNPMNWSLRGIGAADEFVKTFGEQAELSRLAVVEAMEEAARRGLKGGAKRKAIPSLIDGFLQSPTTRMREGMDAFGKRVSLQEELPGPLASIQRGVQWKLPNSKIEPGSMVVPFMRAMYNITKEGLKTVPGAGLRKALGFSKNDPLERVIAEQAVGALAIGSILYGVENGAIELTGAYPVESGRRAAMQNAKVPPWSVKVGDRWIDYRYLGPLGLPFAMAAAYKDATEAQRKSLLGKTFRTEFGRTIGRYMADQSFLTGINGIVEYLLDPQSRKSSGLVANYLSQLVPLAGVQRGITAATDPMVRDTSGDGTFAEDVYNRLLGVNPFLSRRLPERRDKFNRPIERQTYGDPLAALRVGKTERGAEATDKELYRLGLGVNMPSKNIEIPTGDGATLKSEISPDIYKMMVEVSGEPMRAALDAVVASPEYANLPDEAKREILSRIMQHRSFGRANQKFRQYEQARQFRDLIRQGATPQ